MPAHGYQLVAALTARQAALPSAISLAVKTSYDGERLGPPRTSGKTLSHGRVARE
jgi:hypothetical protein